MRRDTHRRSQNPSQERRGRLAGSGQKPDDFSSLAVDESRDAAGDPFRRRFDGVGSEVGVARRGLDLSVPKQLADHGQALAEGHGTRRERMAQVVDANVREADG